jgi:hypothetical protein
VLFFSLCAALRSSDAVSSSRVIATTAPIDVAPPQERLSIQKLSDLGIPNLSQSSRPLVLLTRLERVKGIEPSYSAWKSWNLETRSIPIPIFCSLADD